MTFQRKKIIKYTSIVAIVLLAIAIASIQLWSLPPTSKEPPQGIGGIASFKTASGLKVMYLYAPELPMVDLQLLLDAGSIHDGKNPGIAALTNSLLDRGTKNYSADAFADELAAVGAIIGQNIDKDYASVSLRSLTDPHKFELALHLFFEMLAEPVFDAQSFELRQTQQLATIKYNKQNPGKVAIEEFNQLLYPDHPYGQTIHGTMPALTSLTPQKVQQFFTHHYGVNNAVLAIVGSVDEHTAKEIAEEIGTILAKRQQLSQQLRDPSPTTVDSKDIDFPSQQTHIFYGALGVKRGDPDYFPLYVGSHILGGGMVSKLFQEIRERQGLAYSVYSYFQPRRVAGPFIIGMQTRNTESQRALASTQELLRNFIAQGPTEAELLAAKQYITGNFPLRVSSNSDMVGYLAMIGYYNLPLNYLLEFNNNIEKVTVLAIKDAFLRHIDLENMITVTVGQVSAS